MTVKCKTDVFNSKSQRAERPVQGSWGELAKCFHVGANPLSLESAKHSRL